MTRITNPEDMSQIQAIGIAMLLVDYELENPQVRPIPEEWQNELKSALYQLQKLHKGMSKNNLCPIGTTYFKSRVKRHSKRKSLSD